MMKIEKSIEAEGENAPLIKVLAGLIQGAYERGASDLHFEPMEGYFRVRLRIDGVLQELQNLPPALHASLISRLKIMSGTMDIAERRLPQDGRIRFQLRNHNKFLDLRVSVIPTLYGESAVIRLLDVSSLALSLAELGFLDDDQEKFERIIRSANGMVLITGPTGSGKTTTLYACLQAINKSDQKLITVEDPIEYQIAGINQVQVQPAIGMTFPAALRSILRQAPNILMIGEIRDYETAHIAIHASLTGHLIFSTLHTNDATSAIARLIDIGIPSFLIAGSVRAIIAQRLVRRLCPSCKEPTSFSKYERRFLNVDFKSRDLRTSKSVVPMTAMGCSLCHGKGYQGRMGIFEILILDDESRHLINQGASTLQLRLHARKAGMRTLAEDGLEKIFAGWTTAQEVIASTLREEEYESAMDC
ncbi:MAG: type II secretion system protein E [Verrucomicrobia bacterium]|nr:MAG: type II secretion system protein E [Verrucomicrobiota bacterium]